MKIFIWGLVALLTLLRLIGSFTLPFTGDEAYYWEWSRRLALGYTDHPAGVAWTIAALRGLGGSPGVIRLGFWLCGVVATAAMADCARRFSRVRGGDTMLAAGTAALLTTIAPIIDIAFGTVSPDGPFLASWALTLDAATVLLQAPSFFTALLTGLAIGVGLESRAFALALLAGVVAALRRHLRYALIVGVVALLCCMPLIFWNATHQWVMVLFTLVGRHVDEGFSLLRPPLMLAEVILAFGIGPAIAIMWGGTIAVRRNVSPLLVWTSLPLGVVLFVLSFVERVETYWLLGPYLSLSIATAVLFSEGAFAKTQRTRLASIVPPLFLLSVLYLLIFAAEPLAHVVNTQFHARLHKAGPFNIYGVAALAHDIGPVARARNAIVFADGYGLASLIDYYEDIPPIVIGYSWQGRESRNWYSTAPVHGNGLFVDLVQLHDRSDFQLQLSRACGRVEAGPLFRYEKGDLPEMIFPTTWCLDMKPNAITILRWEQTR